MTQLPRQGELVVPIQWSGTTTKQTMQAGSYVLSGTIGFRPWRETAVLTWVLRAADAQALLNEFKSGSFNRVYDYDCNVMGAVRLRPTESFGFQEQKNKRVVVTVTFERV